jgi:hypothetical protein
MSGGPKDQWSQIPITVMRSRSRIRIKVKSWIRICIKVMRIRIPGAKQGNLGSTGAVLELTRVNNQDATIGQRSQGSQSTTVRSSVADPGC